MGTSDQSTPFLQRWNPERLIAYGKNPRTHSEAQITQIAASIAEFGFNNPILVDSKAGIIAGHGRLLAARKLGLSDVPVIVLDHLSDAQKRAYIIADNRLALNAGWDEELLRLELTKLLEDDFDVSLIGFDDESLARLLAAQDITEGLTDEDAVPELPETPISVKGDLWLLGAHRVLCGDSTVAADVENLLGTVKPHLMVTDPPYGVSYDPTWRNEAGVNKSRKKSGKVANDDRADWREAWALFPGNIVYVWHAGLFSSTVAASIEACDFKLRSQIIWAKDRFALSRGDYHWHHEPCWYAVKGTGNWTGGRSQSTLWQIKSREDSGHSHGTQKPVECMRRPMENNSSPGQAVYDPFLGSGSSVIAAQQTGRHCYGIEINPSYVDVVVKRWQDFTGQEATLENDGRTFAETALAREAKAT